MCVKDESLSVCYHVNDIAVLQLGEYFGLLFEVSLDLRLRRLTFLTIDLAHFECNLSIAFVFLPRVSGQEHLS